MKIPVLFPKIFDYPFTYKSEISESLNSGDFVRAPFGSKEITGVVWPDEQKTEKKFKIKKISKKINVKNLNYSMIEFIKWFSKYNLVPLGMSLKMCLLNKDVVEKNFDKEFNKYIETYDGINARVILHEYDHIEGILFVDKISPLRKRMIKGKLKDISNGTLNANYLIRSFK